MTVSEVAAPELAVRAPVIDTRGKRGRRATFIKWLRDVHGWIGLWGAALGLLFGTTGFVLNHRAGPMRISTGAPQVSTLQAPLPTPAPATPRELAVWLHDTFKLTGRLGRVQREGAHPVAWGDRSAVQPEHWQLMFSTPNENVTAEYWKGNDFVTLKRTENTFVSTLTNLHKGVGLGIGWVLVIDTLASSLILLSVTGVLLWTQLHRGKSLAAALVLGSVALAVLGGLA